MKKILITGCAGFIGSHLCERLLSDGHTVTVLDSATTGRLSNLSRVIDSTHFKVIPGSILDTDVLNPLIKDVDYVFHLAAAVGVFNIVKNPLASLLTNIRGTENVLEAAHASRTPVFLTSSSEVYGKNVSDSLKESDDRILGSPVTLRWSYSEAKAIDESLAYAYYVEKNLETRIVRFFNTVGPRQIGRYGMVVPRFVSAALAGEPLSVYGDGNQSRAFCHIDDVIEALLAVVDSPKAIGQVFNVGNNFEISIMDLARKVIAVTKSNSEIEMKSYEEAYAPGFEDLERRVPDISKIKAELGWAPKRDLTQIIEDIGLYLKNS
jgi:UDP-glucose 4-epimerase